MKLALIVAPVIVAPGLGRIPVAAQVTTSMGQQEPGFQNGQSVELQAQAQPPSTGVFCIEEMTATFCNVPHGPRHGWLRFERRVGRVSGPSGSGGRSRRQRFVAAALPKGTAVQRTVQLSIEKSDKIYLC